VGILQEAAEFVSQRGGTIEEGISHTLSTEAVVLLFVSGTPEQLDLIKRDAPRLGDSLQLMALFTRIVDRDPARDRDALPLTLRISCPMPRGCSPTGTGLPFCSRPSSTAKASWPSWINSRPR
jgi:hypothetical protein